MGPFELPKLAATGITHSGPMGLDNAASLQRHLIWWPLTVMFSVRHAPTAHASQKATKATPEAALSDDISSGTHLQCLTKAGALGPLLPS